MSVLIVPGVLLVLLVAVDVARVVLIPSTRGPVNHLIYRTAWRAARATPRRVRNRSTQFAGPASIVLTIGAWLALLWLGFALVYWARIDDVAFSPDVRFGDRGLVEALYLSGVAITTLGVGDVVGDADDVRLLTTLEAACGLGIFTVAVSYLPTIYTLVSDLRAAALAVDDLGTDIAENAAVVAAHGGVSTVETIHRDVVEMREHLLRFPVLYYFHPPADESPLAMAGNAAGLCATLQWAVDHDHVPHARHWGAVLERAILRLLDELARHLDDLEDASGADAKQRVGAAREAVGGIDPALAARGPVPDAATAFLARVDAVLSGVARMHGYDHRAPLSD